MRDDGFETFNQRNAASAPGRHRRAPSAARGDFVQYAQMSRSRLQMVAAENNGIFTSGVRQFIHEAFIVKALLR